jgi:hypothetical protein
MAEPERETRQREPKQRGSRGRGGRRGSSRAVREVPDPSDTADAVVRFVQPFQAAKSYQCPGCNGTIPAGQGHMVVIPPDDPDLRRHWHRGCWHNRASRY